MKTIRNIRNFIKSIKKPIEFDLETYNVVLKEIDLYHKKIVHNSDNQLIRLSKELKNQAKAKSNDLIVPAYSLVKEVCIRQLGICPFDVQILGAIALHNGKLIEMQTGEGKTLVAVFAAYLNALPDDNVQILTFNDYLAKRDAKWMFPIYNFLDKSVGFVNENMDLAQKRKAYQSNITYASAKENIRINSEGSILNSITLQHLMQKYSKLSGMTATAQQAAEEFEYFYNLKTVVIPPNEKCIRIDNQDLIFKTKKEKYQAIVQEVKKVHETGQPVLIGTLTVKESEELSDNFKNHNLDCEVLNAKNDELEAEIIAKAGMKNAITISTNMAGRGTDIILGGANKCEKELIVKSGGLYVIGTNRHESLRIDRQLRGRSGRQGDIGSSGFFISLEDDLMIRYNLKDALPEKSRKRNSPVNEIAHIQRVIEGQMFDIKRFLYNYSSLIEKQRIIIQIERENTLMNEQISEKTRDSIIILPLTRTRKVICLHPVKRGLSKTAKGGQYDRFFHPVNNLVNNFLIFVIVQLENKFIFSQFNS